MGVLLSAARVEQEAYASGIAETGTKLTETQKVQARMNIILQDSVAMHGDLINTQDSSANQTRNFMNTVKDAATELGIRMQPALQAVLATGNQLADDLLRWSTNTGQFIEKWLQDGGLKQIKEDLLVLRNVAHATGRVTVDALRATANGFDQVAAFR